MGDNDPNDTFINDSLYHVSCCELLFKRTALYDVRTKQWKCKRLRKHFGNVIRWTGKSFRISLTKRRWVWTCYISISIVHSKFIWAMLCFNVCLRICNSCNSEWECAMFTQWHKFGAAQNIQSSQSVDTYIFTEIA